MSHIKSWKINDIKPLITSLLILTSVPSISSAKLVSLPVDQFIKIVSDDITEHQALITADFTRGTENYCRIKLNSNF